MMALICDTPITSFTLGGSTLQVDPCPRTLSSSCKHCTRQKEMPYTGAHLFNIPVRAGVWNNDTCMFGRSMLDSAIVLLLASPAWQLEPSQHARLRPSIWHIKQP